MDTPNSTRTLHPGFLDISPDGNHLPIIALALLIIISGGLYLDAFPTRDPYKLKRIPTVQRPRILDAYRSGVLWRIFVPRLVPYIHKGYYTYSKNGKPFRIWTSGLQDYAYVLPQKYLERAKNLGDSDISFMGFAEKYFSARLPTGEVNAVVVQVISKLLNEKLKSIKPLIQGPAEQALTREIGSPREWKRVNALRIATETVKAPSAPVFFGQTLAENTAFIDAMCQYVMNITTYAFALRFVSVGPLRNFILNLVHWRQRRDLPDIVKPLSDLIAERKLMQSSQHLGEDAKPFDCVQWAMDQAIPEERKTPEIIAQRLILVYSPIIHATAGAITNLLYDIASHKEWIEELREEISGCLAEEGGNWTPNAMAKMVKFDSFIQESFRMSSGLIPLTMLRVVTCDSFRLDEKFVFPKDTLLAFPTRAVQHDPDIFPKPDEFDPLRFYKIKHENRKAGPGSLHRDIRTEWLAFGHGRQACPGKFYAISLIKTIVGQMILRYDIRYAGGDRPRPAIIDLDPIVLPDPSVDLEFKARV